MVDSIDTKTKMVDSVDTKTKIVDSVKKGSKLVLKHGWTDRHTALKVILGTRLVFEGLYVYSRKVRRIWTYWKQAMPFMMDYKGYQMKVKRKEKAGKPISDEKQNIRFQKLHDRWAPLTEEIFLKLRGVYIKFGQVLSSRTDFVPRQYIERLVQFQDDCPATEWKVLKPWAEKLLGGKIETIFSKFVEKPIGSASVGQVHLAKLLDGTDAVLKIQYKGMESLMMADLASMGIFIKLFQKQQYQFHKEFSKKIEKEFNFHNEAWFQQEIKNSLAKTMPDTVKIPQIYHKHTKKRCMVMEYLPGLKLNAFAQKYPEKIEETAEIIGKAWGQQLFVDGCFHGDPHPGNFLINFDEKSEKVVVGILDFGQAQLLNDRIRHALCRLILALQSNDEDKIMEQMLEIGLYTKKKIKNHMVELGRIFFDSGYQHGDENPVAFFDRLQDEDPIAPYPSSLILCFRCAFLIAGGYSNLGVTKSTVDQWAPFCKMGLKIKHDVCP